MQINVAQQLKSPIGSVRDYEVNELIDIAGDDRPGPVQGRVRLMRTDRGILVKGTLNTGIGLTCSRCLSQFQYPLVLEIEEEYFPTVDVVSGAPLTLPEESGCFTIDGSHQLDLTEAIQQYALMAVPMKPLCRPDCAGLCSACGQNLNLGKCGCPPVAADPRWEALKKAL